MLERALGSEGGEVDRKEHAATAVYICWDCGGDFEVSEHDGLTDDLEVECPACGSDLVAVDFAEVRRRRFVRERQSRATTR
jgi:DNA-directed RNA polymerase subunit RPC12/RpoP